MIIKQVDRTETRLNKVHALSYYQNHVAINNINGKLQIDEITKLKSLLNGNQKMNASKKGGYLVKVESVAENTWLISALHADVWIGLNDIEKEGEWRWTSGNAGIPFSYWLSGEPNSGRRENWAHYCQTGCGFIAYGWNDLPCSLPQGYICEKQL
ncbi:unnamed protein product [Mytilus edulis]|uniref:C-type lectin domain-containing protein n=1 Tax=Mytilus edulis TaxID=6550 RepID=A0A8S3V8Y4_MYTED|nr:unnamed protein product [Mytilus edulis]